MKLRTLKQIRNLKNKRVLVRVDFNVPLKNGKIINDSRIKSSIPTIEYLLKKKAKIILMTHLGRPEGVDKKLSLKPMAERLEKLIGQEVFFSELTKFAKLTKLPKLTLLENIRFFIDEAKDKNNFSQKLAELGDIFVLDGFAVAHRNSGSVTGVAKYLPSYAGFLLEKEVVGLSKVTEKPKKPLVVVLGGIKMETKISVLKKLLPKADYVLVGGGLASTYFWAKGYKVGKSVIDKDFKKEALKYLGNKKVVLPVDVVVGKEDGSGARVVQLNGKGSFDSLCSLRMIDAIFDIGPETIRLYAKYIKKAQTLIWNGAMGYFEQKPYDVGTLAIARLVASRSKGKAFGVIGGGETLQSMDLVGMTADVDLVSTGGGAMLEFLAGKKLPGVEIVRIK